MKKLVIFLLVSFLLLVGCVDKPVVTTEPYPDPPTVEPYPVPVETVEPLPAPTATKGINPTTDDILNFCYNMVGQDVQGTIVKEETHIEPDGYKIVTYWVEVPGYECKVFWLGDPINADKYETEELEQYLVSTNGLTGYVEQK